MMNRLAHRGAEGRADLKLENARMGFWRLWTTPEEVGERQPLTDESLHLTILLDGRIDNRDELLRQWEIPRAEAEKLSDAALVLRAFGRWREACLPMLVGEFALAVYDHARNELTCARDPLGDRTLFYAEFGGRLAIASEPWAAAAASPNAPTLNERALAHYFALLAPPDGQTLFNNVYEILPAHALKFDAQGKRAWRYWQPNPQAEIRYRAEEDYAAHFLSLVRQSVRSQMRSASPVGVMLSGGLDSSAVACLAAEVSPEPLRTFSYVFDELPQCDEREYIGQVVRRIGARATHILCDDAYPFKEMESLPRNPNLPHRNAFRAALEKNYAAIRESGTRVILNGQFGDYLYSPGEDWLAEFLAEGRFLAALRELRQWIENGGLRRPRAQVPFRRAARRMVDALPSGKLLRRRSRPPQWLTPFAAALIEPAPQTSFAEWLVGQENAASFAYEATNSGRFGIELRSPFRDRRVVEFVLSIPAYAIQARGQTRFILRNAMRGIMPEAVRTRETKGTLYPLYVKGVQAEAAALEKLLQKPGAAWSKYVKKDWFAASQERLLSKSPILWLCVSYELWQESFSAAQSAQTKI